ncbi:MAG: AMP-binding protein [Verrucomicrobiales bacterium]|nr:AMP-binding protein [Verrucomicrobiales bacterium]
MNLPQATFVQDFLESSADRLPSKTALVCDGRRLSYQEIDQLANRLAHALRAAGVARGDRVAIFLPNCLESVVSIFAVLKAGAAFVVVNHTTKRDKLQYILGNCRASALIAESRLLAPELFADGHGRWLRKVVLVGSPPDTFLDAARAVAPDLPFEKWDDLLARFPVERPTPVNIDLDLACLVYTSGSTGDPKGVMSDHQNVVFASGSIIKYVDNVESDIVLNVLPLSFDYGLYQLLMTFRFGGTLVLERSFTFPAATLKVIEREKVTGFPGVPTIFAVIAPMDLSAFNLSTLRYLTNTAAALPVSHILEIRRKFPWARLYSMYGLTETKRTLYLPPEWLEAKPGSVGIPIPGTEAWLVDENDQRLPNGSTGELVVRGRHVMRGYWEAPEATANRYRPGPLPGERVCYSGDLFRTDADGCFYFVSRKDDIIKSRGEKVSPKEVEAALYSIEGVTQAAVIGVADPVLGQAIKAVLVVQGRTLTPAEVLAHCKARLEDFMVPKHVEFRDAMPLTSSGKIAKRELA